MDRNDTPAPDFSESNVRQRIPAQPSTDTIDLGGLYAEEMNEIGDFDVRVRVGRDEFVKLFQALPIPLFFLDSNGHIVFLNQSCAKLSKNYKFFAGQSFPELFFQGHALQELRKIMAEVLKSRKPKRVKTTLGTGKRALWVRFHFRPLRMNFQQYLLVLVEDLTTEKAKLLLNRKYQASLQDEIEQRIRAEQAIRRSESKYRLLFDKAPVGIIFLVGESRIIFANPKAGEILGVDASKLSNLNFASFVHEEDRHLVPERSPGAIPKDMRFSPYACRIVVDPDNVKWVQINSVSAEWDGQPATLKFIEDITKKRELEDEFLKMQKLDSLGLLAGGIAHDFNNILTAILGNISAGMNSLKNLDQTVSRLAEAERACQKATGLTQQLLTFSKGGVPIKKVTALNTIIKDSCEFALRGSNVSCHTIVAEDLRPADVDSAQITQVINNLAINANQAMPGGGSITIRADNVRLSESNGLPLAPGDYIRIRVIDQGTGITDDVLPHIFDPYFTTKDTGTGLGLATVYSIVKNHDGAITVSTEPNSGSVFSVYLPASDRDPEPVSDLEDTPESGVGRILVMDDEPSVRDLLKDALEHLGYDVEATKDGKEALQRYAACLKSSDAFSVVILDLTVPGGMGGLETAAEIRKIDPSAKLIISSGYSNDPVMANHEAYGIDAVVPKPYTIGDLCRALRSVKGDDRGVEAGG